MRSLRTFVSYAAATLLAAAVVSGCSVAHTGAAVLSHPVSLKPTASGTSTGGKSSYGTAASRPLAMLPIPVGAQPWTSNTNKPLSLTAFVHGFYVKDAWTDEAGQDSRRRFVSGAIEGWINTDGSQQYIAIAKFATPQGAVSMFDGLTGTLRDLPSPHKVLTDPRDGGVGTVSPTLDADGNAIAEIAVRTGDYVIDVHEFTAVTPDSDAAKALLLHQFDTLKDSKNAKPASN
jgi:hypothetical protein